MDTFKIAALAMQADQQRMATISQNLANVSTSGYKREVAVVRPFREHMETEIVGSNMANESRRDHAAGVMRATGNPTDIAIEGSGFLEVQTDQGIAYTRQGSLHIDAQGRLATASGHIVSGVSGAMNFTAERPRIEANGQVYQGMRPVGQLRVVRFINPEALGVLGDGLYSRGSAQIDESQSGGVLRAGYLENSNVNSAREMVHMTDTVRHYEALQKLLQGREDVFDKAVRKLSDF